MKYALLVFLLLLVDVDAGTELVDVDIVVDGTGTSYVTEVFYLNDSSGVSFEIDGDFVVYDSHGDLNYSLVDGIFYIEPREESFTLQYVSDSLTSKINESWELNYKRDYVSDKIVVSVVLPGDSFVDYVYPRGYHVKTPLNNVVDFYDSKDVIVGYSFELESLPVANPVDKSDPLSYLHLVLFLAALVLGVLIFFKSRKKISPGQKDILNTLSEKEEGIIRLVLEHNGRMGQSKIRSSIGLPKATLSRNLKNLQSKGLIEVREVGHSNVVLLSDWFKKK
tara:strand:+ start:2268 stop:3104 length:837 start_codon:yes stop_codon:yes gene_type:complete